MYIRVQYMYVVNLYYVYVCHCVIPLKVTYLCWDSVEIITGQVELSQGEDLTYTLREDAQTVVRQVQALQLGKPKQRENSMGNRQRL